MIQCEVHVLQCLTPQTQYITLASRGSSICQCPRLVDQKVQLGQIRLSSSNINKNQNHVRSAPGKSYMALTYQNVNQNTNYITLKSI